MLWKVSCYFASSFKVNSLSLYNFSFIDWSPQENCQIILHHSANRQPFTYTALQVRFLQQFTNLQILCEQRAGFVLCWVLPLKKKWYKISLRSSFRINLKHKKIGHCYFYSISTSGYTTYTQIILEKLAATRSA